MYDELIDRTKYQVFLFVSNAVMPFSFAKHPWFVVNRKGEISRWEIIVDKRKPTEYVRRDYCKPYIGSGVFPSESNRFYFKEKLLGYISGDESSTARDIVETILRSKEEYPFRDMYRYLGPNSNTYAQWILNMYPEFNAKLPWNSFGKEYKLTNFP